MPPRYDTPTPPSAVLKVMMRRRMVRAEAPDSALVFAASLMACILLAAPVGTGTAQEAQEARVSQPLVLSRPITSIGIREGPGPAAFGDVADVELDASLNIYVLDRGAAQIRVFASNGTFRGNAGGPGRAQGKLAQPVALVHDGESSLYVVDRRNGVTRFETRGGTPRVANRFAEDYAPWDACALGPNVVVAAWHGGKLLHVFSADGAHLASFGESFSHDTSDHLRAVVNRAGLVVACDSHGDAVYVTGMTNGVVRCYSSVGVLRWERTLPGFRAARYIEAGTTVITLFAKSFATGLIPLGEDALVVQVANQVPQKGESAAPGEARIDVPSKSELVTYVLSTQNGAPRTRASGVLNLRAARMGSAVALEDDPFPVVKLVSWKVSASATRRR